MRLSMMKSDTARAMFDRSSGHRSLRLAAATGLVAAALLAGCDGGRLLVPTGQTTKDLIAASALWKTQGFSRYEFTLVRSCFCVDVQPMRVTVNDGVVASVRPEISMVPLPQAEWSWYPSIERLFVITAEELARPAATVDAEFDSVRGFPHRIYIDRYANMADDEVMYTVTNVRVR